MKHYTILLITLFLSTSCIGQSNLKYLQQVPPTLTPKVFAPNIISRSDLYEFGSIFSTDHTEFFFGVNVGGRAEIQYSKLENNTWSTPITIIEHESYGHNDPMLSPDQQRLYYISDRPREGENSSDYDIWYSERLKDGWSSPINAGSNINSTFDEYYISFTESGTMYYASNKDPLPGQDRNFDIYYSPYAAGAFQKSTRLGRSINTPNYEADVFIAPDESYIIFCSTRKDGFGRGDLYISFKNESGDWTEAVNMKAPVNTKGHELCPWVSEDGKYFFYTSNQDIYWVSTDIFENNR